MGDYIKNGLKALTGYLISLLIFGVFLYVFLSIAKESFSKWLPVYSFVFFLLMFAIIYSDYKRLAVKERKPQYNLNPYPVKGLLYGLIGFSPFILMELVYPLIILDNPAVNRLKEVAFKTLLGPLYWLIRLMGGTVAAYAAAALVVPVVAMLGYLAGFYGFELGKHFKTPAVNQGQSFSKSPWNPSVENKAKSKKK